MKKTLALLAVGILAVGTAGPVSAAPPRPGPMILAEGLVSPLHVSVGAGGTPIVSQEFTGMLTRLGTADPLYANPGWDVAGTATRGSTTFVLESQGAGGFDGNPLAGHLQAIDSKGTVRTVTDKIAQFEQQYNPDGQVRYGLSPTASADCAAQLAAVDPRGSYAGEVDSHPYALAVQGNTAYVADAGGNDILAVNLTSGAIRAVAVIPGRTVTLPASVQGQDIPACEGEAYGLEPVPTDVAIGPDGWLYVSSLPGGPEDGSLGANGAVFRVNPATGAVQEWVTGLVSPTGLAFDGSGNLYIASLFGGGIFKVEAGTHAAEMFLAAPLSADVTVNGSTLYATTNALPGEGEPPNGKLISLKL